jgi:membrane protein YqaA with SNARE-associated domain
MGAAILTFFAILTLAGGNDVIAVFLDLSVERLTWIFRILAIVAPIVVGVVTWWLCRNRLARPAPDELEPMDAEHADDGPAHAGVALRRTPAGGFEEVEG